MYFGLKYKNSLNYPGTCDIEIEPLKYPRMYQLEISNSTASDKLNLREMVSSIYSKVALKTGERFLFNFTFEEGSNHVHMRQCSWGVGVAATPCPVTP